MSNIEAVLQSLRLRHGDKNTANTKRPPFHFGKASHNVSQPKPRDSYCSGPSTSNIEVVDAMLDPVERSSTTRKTAPKINDASPRRAPKGKRSRIHNDEGETKRASSTTDAVKQTPFGTFLGDTIYRNRIAPNEKGDDGHYSIQELVLPDCTSALCTTMEGSSTTWLQQVFGSIPSLLVVAAAGKETPHTIGNAVTSPMHQQQLSTDEESDNKKEIVPIPNWWWLKCRPHTGGCLHSKLLLFRSDEGLRVIVSGNNLSKYQWEGQRDVFWAQDFPSPDYKTQREKGSFGFELFRVLSEMTRCAEENDRTFVDSRIEDAFAGIDFHAAKARLVVSFPRQKGSVKDSIGWKKLATAVTSRLMNCGMLQDSDSDDSECNGTKTDNPEPRVLYATSGSFGDLEPDFLLQMYEAMNGNETQVLKSTSWDDVHDLVKCFWPGKTSACTMDLMGLVGALRSMPQSKLDKIPKDSLRRVFHDAIPNPPTKFPSRLFGGREPKFHVVTHGKFLYNTRGVLYVGSHNFSRAAWGLRDAQPKNVEIGVVLATLCPDKRKEWCSRLPCQLVSPDEESPEAYSPYTRYTDIEEDHPDAQNRVVGQAIRLYQQAEEVWSKDHEFFVVPLESVLQWSTDAIQKLVREFGPKLQKAKERKAKVVSGLYFCSSDSDSD